MATGGTADGTDGGVASTGGATTALGGATSSTGGAGGSKSLPAITGFTVLNQADPGGLVRCNNGGTCFKTATYVYELAPNATAFGHPIPDPTYPGGGVNLVASGLAIDSAGAAYTAGSTDIVKIVSGASSGTFFGTTGALSVSTFALGQSLAMDGSGSLYLSIIGATGTAAMWRLPAGQTTWAAVDPTYNKSVAETLTSGGDVYIAGDFVYVLKAGASAFAKLADSPARPAHLAMDSAGTLYGYFMGTGTTKSTVSKLIAGGTTWTDTGAPSGGTGNGGEATNLVVDGKDNVYLVASDATTPSQSASLFKLAAGASAWAKLFDVVGLLAQEPCGTGSLADDHIGHLILQCRSTLLRSTP